ncbi:hypothetical protein Trydic_g8467 [Trypoxylus dichotomus]
MYCLFGCSKITISWLIFLLTCLLSDSINAEHRTKEASLRPSDLYCFRCDTMVDGERCQDLRDNTTSFTVKCSNEQRTCKVKSISMSASTEDITGKPKLWLLQRNCSKSCEPGCIVIGERTKLHSCTTCCEKSLCNIGNGCRKASVANGIFKGLAMLFFLERFIKSLFVTFPM